MYWFNICFVLFILLPNILCHVDKNYIKKQNDVMKEFVFVCILLIVIGFVIGPILLIIVLPFIVDPIIVDEEELRSSSDESQKVESSDSSSLLNDDEESINEQDTEEISSF